MLPRYQVLYRIPDDLRDIQASISRAMRLRPDDPDRKSAIVEAASGACDLLSGLVKSPPVWLALQRQVMVRGWSFEDLKDLDRVQIQTAPLVTLFAELRGPLAPDPEVVVEDALRRLHQVRDEALEAMQLTGLTFPDGTPAFRVVDSALVDHAHDRMQQLCGGLAALLQDARQWDSRRESERGAEASSAAQQERARESEQRWEQVLRVSAEAVTVLMFLTAMAVDGAEVWKEVQQYAAALVRMFGEVRDALSREIALLGIVVAIRRTDLALGGFPDDLPGQSDGPGAIPPPGGFSPPSTHSLERERTSFADQASAAGEAPEEHQPKHGERGTATRRALEPPNDPQRRIDGQQADLDPELPHQVEPLTEDTGTPESASGISMSPPGPASTASADQTAGPPHRFDRTR